METAHRSRISLIFLSITFLLAIVPVLSPKPSQAQSAPSCVQAPAGLIAWLPGDGSLDDLVTGTTTASAPAGLSYGAGQVDQSFGLNGAGQSISIPSGSVPSTASITLAAWVNPASLSGYHTIASKYSFTDGNPNVSWALINETGTGRLIWLVYGNGGTSYYGIQTAPVLATNAWQFVTVTHDAGSQVSRIHINGVAVATSIYNEREGPTPIGSINSSSAPVRIGSIFSRSEEGFWNGQIDEFSIFNRALSASEIQAIFNAGSAGMCKGSAASLTIEAERDDVWANGHREAKLTARLVDANGQAVAGKKILLWADDSAGNPAAGVSNAPVWIFPVGVNAPGEATTNALGEAVFRATSTKVDDITFRAEAMDNPGLTDSVDVSFQRHKIVVQVQGINTSLTCGSPSACTGSSNFGAITGKLLLQGFEAADFLWYSYRGGIVDPILGEWQPSEYRAGDTSQDLAESTRLLQDLLRRYGEENPNTDFYVLGHSQGGLLAFQAIGFVSSMTSTSRIHTIITLDGAIGGAPNRGTMVLRTVTSWGAPASSQLGEIYQSTTGIDKATTEINRARQGSAATLFCSTQSVCPDFPSPITNQEAAIANSTRPLATKIDVHTIGADGDDAVYNPATCGIIIPFVSDFNNTSAQVVDGTNVRLVRMDGNTPQPINPITGINAFMSLRRSSTDVGLAVTCLLNSHSAVFEKMSNDVSVIIQSQIGR